MKATYMLDKKLSQQEKIASDVLEKEPSTRPGMYIAGMALAVALALGFSAAVLAEEETEFSEAHIFFELNNTDGDLGIHALIDGDLRYFFESIRAEIQQYFVESDLDGRPLPREFRSLVYQRAKGIRDTRPFGSQFDFYRPGCEWVSHSLAPSHIPDRNLRVKFGGPDCRQPYQASPLNISAMSYGALSKNAILALNLGAQKGDFAHNSGEGGLSEYHLKYGGDIIWQIGTGYFGCRNKDGNFDAGLFKENATKEVVKMIEIKLSQGANPVMVVFYLPLN